jgi:hypothetical protein
MGQDGAALVPPSLLNDISERLNMPAEYLGVLVTNAETTTAAYAFLTQYRCAKYHTNCN